MSRIRTIKPDFWSDEKLTECSLSARLLFIGTWNFADDAGNLDRSAKQIKARVFPIDDIDCEPLLRELITQGVLSEYSVNDKTYLHIKGFLKHQLINRPSKPSCPAFDESLIVQGVLTEYSLSTHDGRKEGKEGNRIELAETPISKPKSTKAKNTPIPPDFGISESVHKWATKDGHTRLAERLAHFVGYAKSSGKTYADWDQAFMNSIRDDWAKLGKIIVAPEMTQAEQTRAFMMKMSGLTT